jgi:DNA-binding MarR family transcriptional regulator
MTQKRRLIYQINMARHAMMKSMDNVCVSALGITATQLTALMILKEKGACQMKELADALMLDKSAVTGLTKRLQSKSLVERMPSENDLRASVLLLSEEGQRVLDNGMTLLAQANNMMSEGFSDDELDTVSRYLNHLTTIFSRKIHDL